MKSQEFIKNGFYFLIVSVLINFTLLTLMCKMSYDGKPAIYRTADVYKLKGGNSFQKFQEFDKDKKYDIIIIGSSHANSSYDPRNFQKAGLGMYNLGTSGQTPLNTYFVAKNYIKSDNCKMVLFDIYDGIFNSNGFESSSDLIQNISSNKAAIEIAGGFTNPQVINMLALRFINSNSEPAFLDSTYVKNGYSENNDTIKYSLPFDEYENRNTPSTSQIKYLEKTIKYLQEKNIKVVLTSIPLPKEISKSEHKKLAELISEIAKKYSINYLDYSFNSNFDTELNFYDSHNLNQDGVNLYNKILLQDLRKMNLIK